ncbi:MAG: hypothetical protein HEQ40_03670 [Lacibacter sp.]
MQRNLIIILLVTITPLFVKAQNGNGLLNKIKNKVNNRVDKKIDGEIDKTLDKIEGKEQTTANNSKTNEASTGNNGLQSYIKYDFVPGEQVIYSNDFAADAMGELPVGWNSNGTGAVVTINGLLGKWAQLHQNSVYLTDNKDSLTENFTVEFDLVLRRTNPKAPFPMLVFGVLASGTYEPTANELLKDYTYTFATELKVQPYDNNASLCTCIRTMKEKNILLPT